ncbi:MAG: hypothetical protein ACTSRF_08090 [Candidatus Freyarchaeota archaeon]
MTLGKISDEQLVEEHGRELNAEEGADQRRVLSIFLEHGYTVDSYDLGGAAWRIHEEQGYCVLELVVFRSTTVDKIRSDRRMVRSLYRILLSELNSGSRSLVGDLEFRRLFGVNVPYHRGRQVMIVADEFLVSRSRAEGDARVDSVEVVPVSELSSMLEGRRDGVLRRARRMFRPDKGRVLEKAYSRARTGLILTGVFLVMLVPLMFLNVADAVFQLLLILDSVLILATIGVSLVLHEWGVVRFKKLLREELAAFHQKLGPLTVHQSVTMVPRASQKLPSQQTELSLARHTIPSTELSGESGVEGSFEHLLAEGGKSSEFYARRRDGLWDLAHEAFAEGDWDNCAYHLRGAVGSALKEVYVKLTGKAAFGSLQHVTELVCKKTGLDPERFQRFFERIDSLRKPTEAELSRLFEHAEGLLTDLQSPVSTTAPLEVGSAEGDEKVKAQEESERDEKIEAVLSLHTVKGRSKAAKGKREGSSAGEGVSVGGESGRLHSESEFVQSRLVGETEAEITSCDSVVETICADGEIREELKRLSDTKGDSGFPVFLVVTQSSEVLSIVESLKGRYPGLPIGACERAVNGKAQIIVSRDGEINDRIDYESPEQLERLVKSYAFEGTVSRPKLSGDSGSIEEFLEE